MYDEIEIEDMEYKEEEETYFYPCPCGDKFQITKDQLSMGESIAHCPSCSLVILVIYDPDEFDSSSSSSSSSSDDEE